MHNVYRSGHTLLELTCLLVLLGALTAITGPPVTALRDRIAVRSAGSLLVSGLTRARTLAVMNGGARAIIDLHTGTVRFRGPSGAELGPPVEIATPLGVQMYVGGRTDSLVLRLDGRGLGQLAGASIEIRRGKAIGGVIISGFGRARQW